jgi:hypothetical protein
LFHAILRPPVHPGALTNRGATTAIRMSPAVRLSSA